LSTIGMIVFGAIAGLTAPSCHGHIEWWMFGFFIIQLLIFVSSFVAAMISALGFMACLLFLIFPPSDCNGSNYDN